VKLGKIKRTKMFLTPGYFSKVVLNTLLRLSS